VKPKYHCKGTQNSLLQVGMVNLEGVSSGILDDQVIRTDVAINSAKETRLACDIFTVKDTPPTYQSPVE
jgi:hypothetical protein